MVCSLGTEAAFGPSIFGVHSGGALGSVLSVSSIYLNEIFVRYYICINIFIMCNNVNIYKKYYKIINSII